MVKNRWLSPLLFTAAPVLALYAANIRQIELIAMVRSLIFALLFGSLVYGVCWLFLRKWGMQSPVASILLFVFFTYGHLQKGLLGIPLLGKVVGRTIFIVPLLMVIIGFVFLYFWKHPGKLAGIQRTFNTFAIILFLIPVLQISYYLVSQAFITDKVVQPVAGINVSADVNKPNIYYIILDTYGRQDVLKETFGIDNSEFIQQLNDRGFYVADCSLSNYPYTSGSLGSSLNMDYIYNVVKEPENSRKLDLVFATLSDNRVRRTLESIGYKTVAFDTGYKWVDWTGTEVFYNNPSAYITDPFMYPFETLLLDTTVLRVLEKHDLLAAKDENAATGLDYVRSQVKKIYSALDNLKKTPDLSGPLFVYAHLLVPHPPYVFKPDGTADWTNYFDEHTGEMSSNVDKYQGYSNNVHFISRQILSVVDSLLAADPNTVIIIQGDHSSTYGNAYPILNVYYFPDRDYASLYPEISPVNSFRMILNHFFHTEYPLLPDLHITKDVNLPFWRGTVDPQMGDCK